MKLYLPIILILMFSACNKETDCPSFPSAHLQWLPYKTGEQVIFVGPKGSQMFTITEAGHTRAYTIGNSEACDCEADAHSTSAIDSTSNIQLTCSAIKLNLRTTFEYKFSHYKYLSSYYVPLNIDNFQFSINKSGALENASEVGQITVGGQKYEDVIMVEIDTVGNRAAEIFRIYLAPGKGIVQYDYKSGESFGLRDL